MRPSELITIEPIKTMFGKSTGQYCARITDTDFSCIEKTREDALQSLSNRLLRFSSESGQRKYFFTKSGEVLCLYSTFWGFSYDIVRNDGKHPGVTHLSCKTWTDAVLQVASHAAEYDRDFLAVNPVAQTS